MWVLFNISQPITVDYPPVPGERAIAFPLVHVVLCMGGSHSISRITYNYPEENNTYSDGI